MRYKVPTVTASNPISATVLIAKKALDMPYATSGMCASCADSFSLVSLARFNPPQSFQSITAQPASLREPSVVTANVMRSYDELIGDRGREAFEQHTVPMAMSILGSDPKRVEEILLKLIDQASYLTPEELDGFWDAHVTTDTFEFHNEYQELLKPATRGLGDYLFHIGSRLLLEMADTLVPEYIRKGEEFDAEHAKEVNYDGFEICFVTGRDIDKLTRFLIGHVLTYTLSLDKDDDKSLREDILECNAFFMPLQYAVVAVGRQEVVGSGKVQEHGIHTTYAKDYSDYSEQNTIQEMSSWTSQDVEHLITIPLTIVTEAQIAELRAEGEQYYRNHIETGEVTPELPFENASQAGAIYAAVRQQELALKYALVKFAEQQPNLK